MDQRAAPTPFAIIFPIAALDAVAVGCGWLAALSGRFAHWSMADVVEWHQNELLFGFVAAAMAGFLFTALPRWTGRPMSRTAIWAFIGLWTLSRFIAAHPWPLRLVQAFPTALLAVIGACHVVMANDRRNWKTVMLLALYAAAGFIRFGPFEPEIRSLGANAAIAAALGLAMLIGGRILPALAAHFDTLCGEAPESRRRAPIEVAAASLAIAALLSQLLAPEAGLTPPLLFVAGAAQFLRMASWIGRRTFEARSLVGLFATYACIPLGFIVLAAHGATPDVFPTAMATHAWLIGGLGGMILTIMSSMIRKRCGLAFAVLPGGDAAVAFCLIAAAARAGAAFEPRLLPIAATAWSAAFGLFLLAFRAPLLEAAVKGRSLAQRRKDRTESHW